jgi:hypothetical protein
MVDVISVANARAAQPLTFRRIVVIGGGCYGSWYTQQLTRATQRGALMAQEIVVVDRDPHCRVASQLERLAFEGANVRLEVTPWDEYLAGWLADGPQALQNDAMVPSPLMPHLCLDWLIARAHARWPARRVHVEPLPAAPPTPWERAAPDNRHYVSFATWTCPVNCIEPAKCPATRDVRDWSMPVTIQHMVDEEPTLRGATIFQCTHRTFGVGMIDAAAIAQADQTFTQWGNEGPCRMLVGTVSHCHGALGVLELS